MKTCGKKLDTLKERAVWSLRLEFASANFSVAVYNLLRHHR